MKLFLALSATIGSMLCAVAAPDQSGHDKIMAAMDGMIFQKIQLKNATIGEAVRLLTEESKKSDPEHQGIRFVVHAPAVLPPASITMDEHNACLKMVLKKIQRQTGWAYTVGKDAIYLWYDNGEGLTRRTFTVPVGFFETTPEQSPQSSYDVKSQL